jgi:hypothetical protein
MEPGSRSSGFAGREGRVREGTCFFIADPCIDFRIDVDKADDVALMKVIQYRRQLMWHIDEGSEVQHGVRPSFLRQMSSGTAKAAAGTIAKTKQISGGSSLPSPAAPHNGAYRGRSRGARQQIRQADSGGSAASSWGAPADSTPNRRHIEFLIDHLRPHMAPDLWGKFVPHRIGTDS